MNRRISCAALLTFLTACGGGGTMPNGPVVNDPGGGDPPPTQRVNVKVTVTVPQGSKARAIRPDYVSVNTQSLVIELSSVDGKGVSGINPTTINTQSSSRNCKEEARARACSAVATGSPGDDVFSVTTYAGANATGAVLSVGTVRSEVRGGGTVQISNRLSLTLDGVIAALKLMLSPDHSDRGKPVESAVTLGAFDASGAQIVGPSDYSAPVALNVQNDTGRTFLLHAYGTSGTSLTIAKPTSNITLSYDGNSRASNVTVAASVEASGSTGASSDFTLRGKVPPPPVGTIYALNFGANDGLGATVTEYSGKANGNTRPERTLQLSTKLYARSIAVDAKGELYVGYFDNAYGFSPSSGKPDKGNEVATYAPGASGNATPTSTLVADSATQTTLFPLYMAFDPSGDLVTYGATRIDGNGGNAAVLTYEPGSTGAKAPVDAWAFAAPELYYAGPTGLAIDASGNFYVNGALHTSLGPSYGLFAAPAADRGSPSVSPSRTIPWDSTTELTPELTTNVALNGNGELFIGNTTLEGSGSYPSCQGRANVFAAGSGGGTTDVPPLGVLTLSGVYTQNPQCDSPRNPLAAFFPSIALFGTTLFVADDFNDAISAYSDSGNGTVKPSLRIAGSATGLEAPVALVITSPSGRTNGRSADSRSSTRSP